MVQGNVPAQCAGLDERMEAFRTLSGTLCGVIRWIVSPWPSRDVVLGRLRPLVDAHLNGKGGRVMTLWTLVTVKAWMDLVSRGWLWAPQRKIAVVTAA